MVGRVVGGAVLPAVPDGVEPGAGQDAHGVGVVVSSGDGAVVAVGGPEVGSAAVTGEVADGVAAAATSSSSISMLVRDTTPLYTFMCMNVLFANRLARPVQLCPGAGDVEHA